MASRGAGAAAGCALPPVSLPPGAEKHAAALWTFLDELSADPEAYAKFVDEQAKAAGVDGFDAFRARLAQPHGGVGAAAQPEEVLAAAAAAARQAGGHELPPELLTRLASLGGRGAPAKAPARRAPLVQELPEAVVSAEERPACAAPPPAPVAAALSPARAGAPHTLTVEPGASVAEPHGALVLSAQLFDVASAREVRLEATEWEALLLRAGTGAHDDDAAEQPLLRVALPERCLAHAATAKWDKRAKRLTVRLPRAPPMV